ncbi:Arginine/ornithine antiporter ArcD [hydrothermal vent metagenome]|uniref:Arginine/ornithine antiporter ArcD n=1 Tax=hydrothermal vent metagenome TaxID=652676 RepID=A0A1W1EEJ5_9ZZZZ
MNDHNLDDLIIDDVEPKKNKTKSLLTIFALLIVVFIVAIILTSVVLDEPNSNSQVLEENVSEMISPELTLQSAAKSKEKKEEIKLTEVIEEELNKPLAEPKTTQEPEQVEVKEKEPVVLTKPEVVVPAEPKSTPNIKTEPVKTVEVPKPMYEEQQHVVKPKAVPTHEATSVAYYIQVGSYSKLPSQRLLSSIHNNGFKYKLTTPNDKGLKKLLIGPYPSRAVVDTALVRVRDLINKSAFVVKK